MARRVSAARRASIVSPVRGIRTLPRTVRESTAALKASQTRVPIARSRDYAAAHFHRRPARADGRARRVRPARHGREPAGVPCARAHRARRRLRAAHRGRHACAPLPHPLERAAEELRAEAPARLRVLRSRASRASASTSTSSARRSARPSVSFRRRSRRSRSSACRRSCTRSPSIRAGSCSSPARPAPASRRRSRAIIDEINRTRAEHILTIEDPIEFVHRHKKCIVNQREIGTDATSFAEALRAALRQDPDVILVGEMRDLETISTRAHRRRDRPPRLRHAAHAERAVDDRPHHRRLPAGSSRSRCAS